MKSFALFRESCWKGYTAIGVKKKNGKTVPNCVPVKEDGMGAVAAGPTSTSGSGAVAGLGQPPGSKSGEPGVTPKAKKSPVLLQMAKRKPPME